jgi:hypothetical protein
MIGRGGQDWLFRLENGKAISIQDSTEYAVTMQTLRPFMARLRRSAAIWWFFELRTDQVFAQVDYVRWSWNFTRCL